MVDHVGAIARMIVDRNPEDEILGSYPLVLFSIMLDPDFIAWSYDSPAEIVDALNTMWRLAGDLQIVESDNRHGVRCGDIYWEVA